MKTLFAALCVMLTGTAHAGLFAQVEVVDRASGQTLPLYNHGGRLYVAGTPGEKYAVRVANRSSGRVLTVVSVDGVNAVTGETAAAEQNGYVLYPGQSFEVNGWRKSRNEIAAFYFTRLPDSYAARTDRPENVGVIGVAVFREWLPPRPRAAPQPLQDAPASAARESSHSGARPDAEARDAAAPPALEAKRAEKIGTGHGEREASPVTYTDFRRASSWPSETLTIHYDTHANLVARGVIPRAPSMGEPNPFPGGRFVPDPRG
jgi:hypothetical protein